MQHNFLSAWKQTWLLVSKFKKAGMRSSSFLKVFCFLILIDFISPESCSDGKIRGANLGGWLLLEPWITPEIFREANGEEEYIVDEWTFAQFVDKDLAAETLKNHWETFITRRDQDNLAENSCNIWFS